MAIKEITNEQRLIDVIDKLAATSMQLDKHEESCKEWRKENNKKIDALREHIDEQIKLVLDKISALRKEMKAESEEEDSDIRKDLNNEIIDNKKFKKVTVTIGIVILFLIGSYLGPKVWPVLLKILGLTV